MTAAYPLSAIRAVALHAQGLAEPTRRGSRPDIEEVCRTVERVGWVQIDTLQVVNRAQYLTLWSRLGSYDTGLLDQMLFDGGNTSPDNRRRLFEYWAHAACIIPLTEYRNFIPLMRRRAEGRNGWHRRWTPTPEQQEPVRRLYEQVKSDGAATPADFRTEKKAAGSWFDWDYSKRALEYLYDIGDLAISNRINFQRIYDVRERVLPSWVDQCAPPEEEAVRRLFEISVRALGICTPGHVGPYFHMSPTEARPLVQKLIDSGTFARIEAQLADRTTGHLLIHRDDLPLLEAAADGEVRAERTTFLNPFDSLFWARNRDRDFWGFHQVLECYKREHERIWGYFCLPILDRDRLVGRFDPKMERRSGLLRIKSLYLEPGVRPSARLASSIAGAMRDFMRFHDATDLVIEESDPPAFGSRVVSAVS